MTKTEGKTLESVLPLLGEAYRSWKEWEEVKNSHKDEFFTLADEEIRRRGLAVKMVEYRAPSHEVAAEYVARHYPAWEVEEGRAHRTRPEIYEFVLKELPEYKPFSTEHDGVKYGRTVSKGAVMLDDEWLKRMDPELYVLVTYELPWGQRIAIPVEHMSQDMVGRLRPYIYTAKPRVSLAQPRPVKTEDE